MASNFDFLTTGWATLHEDAVDTELNVFLALTVGALRRFATNGHPPTIMRHLYFHGIVVVVDEGSTN